MAVNQGTAQALPEPTITGLRPKRTFLQEFVTFLKTKRLGTFGLVVAVLMVISAVFAPYIANHDPYATPVEDKWIAPNTNNYFGGDHLGRDVFSRIVYGARISLVVVAALHEARASRQIRHGRTATWVLANGRSYTARASKFESIPTGRPACRVQGKAQKPTVKSPADRLYE